MQPDPVITWGTRPAVAMEFTVNFGVFAGRDVSLRELQRLGEVLVYIVERVSLIAEHRHALGGGSTVALHQVRVELDRDVLPGEEEDVESLRARIAEELELWVRACLTGVSGQELTEAEILARDAVVEGVLDDGG